MTQLHSDLESLSNKITQINISYSVLHFGQLDLVKLVLSWNYGEEKLRIIPIAESWDETEVHCNAI